MIVLFSWLFIFGLVGFLGSIIWIVTRLATKKKFLLKKSAIWGLCCFMIALIGAGGAMSSIPDSTSNNNEVHVQEVSPQKNDDKKPVQINSIANSNTTSANPVTDQKQESKEVDLLTSLQKSLEDSMFENFGGSGDEKYAASWYRSIKSYHIKPEGDYGFVIYVNTTLYHDDEGKKFAEEIPTSIWGWVNSKKNNIDVRAVVVNSQNGKPLIYKNNPISLATTR